MSVARPNPPGTNGGHAGAAAARVHDGRSTVRIMIMVLVMTTAVAVAAGNPARIIVLANDLTVHAQDDRAKGGCIGAVSRNNESLARHRAGHRRLALSAITGGQS